MKNSNNHVLKFLQAIPSNSFFSSGMHNTTISNIIFDFGTFQREYATQYRLMTTGQNTENLRALHNSLASSILPNHTFIQKTKGIPTAETSIFYQLACEKAWLAAADSISGSVLESISEEFKSLVAQMGSKYGTYLELSFSNCSHLLKKAYIQSVRHTLSETKDIELIKDESMGHYFYIYSFFEALLSRGFVVKSFTSKSLGKEIKKSNRTTLSGAMNYIINHNLGKVQVHIEKSGISHVFSVDLKQRLRPKQLMISPVDDQLMELSLICSEFSDLLLNKGE